MSELIIAEYLSTTNPSGVTNSPVCVYRFDSTVSSLLDRTGQGRDFSVDTGSESYIDDVNSGLIGIDLDSVTLIAPSDEVLRIAKDDGGGGDASLTIEVIMKKISFDSQNYIIGCVGDLGQNSLPTNLLYSIGGFSGTNAYSHFEHDNGINEQMVFGGTDHIEDNIVYLAMTVSADGITRKMYLNGSLMDTRIDVVAEKDTSGNTQRLQTFDSDYTLYSLRITDEVFDDADILDVYNELLDEPTPEFLKSDESALEDGKEFITLGGEEKYSGFSYPDVRVGLKFYPKSGAQEDSYEVKDFGTRKNRRFSNIGSGYVLPRSSSINNYDKNFDNQKKGIGGFEDEQNFLEVGGKDRHTEPQIGGGLCFNFDSSDLSGSKLGIEDDYRTILGSVTDVNISTSDIHGHAHFLSSIKPPAAYYYDTSGEPWARPWERSFSGYSRQGYRYTDGIQDSGPINAPWRSEPSSDYRSPDPEFPYKSLIVAGSKELVIFDLDNYDGAAANLVVWMRFMYDDMSHFKALGRGEYSVKAVKMINGVLIVTTDYNGTENGGLITIDFRATGQNVFSLIRSDGHWHANLGYTIRNRNDTGGVYTQTGVSPSLRIAPEYVRSVDAMFDIDEISKMWVVVVGEDQGPDVVTFDDNVGQIVHNARGDDLGDNNVMTDNYRKVHIDSSGWLWISRGNKIWRNVYDYQYGRITLNSINKNVDRMAEFPADIQGVTSSGNNLFILTDLGVYMMSRGTMDYWFAYSIPGYGSGGKNNISPEGDILVGEYPNLRSAIAFSALFSDFIVVSSYFSDSFGGGVSVVRLLDNRLVKSYVYPQLHEDGCFWGLVLPVVR
jgi:hypothetical protein